MNPDDMLVDAPGSVKSACSYKHAGLNDGLSEAIADYRWKATKMAAGWAEHGSKCRVSTKSRRHGRAKGAPGILSLTRWIFSALVLALASDAGSAPAIQVEAPTGDTRREAVLSGGMASSQAEDGSPSLPSGHRKMLTLLRQIADNTGDNNVYLGDGDARRLREGLAALPHGTSEQVKWQLQMQAGQAELRLGNEAEAIDHFRQAIELVRLKQGQVPPRVVAETVFWLGVAYMRQGETQNCCLLNSPDSCILPLRGGGIHIKQDPSLGAIASFTGVLQTTRPSGPLHLAARWLLNIAHMTVGSFPERVPEPYLLSPRLFESEEKIPRFRNIAPRLGLDTFDLSGGAVAEDFDNDGYLDIVVSTWDTAGQIRFFRNNRDGTFSERTKEAKLLGLYGGLNLIQADYDNDGDIDILVLRGAWLGTQGRHPNSLLRNNGDSTFTDVTFEAGLGEHHYPTQTASWGDYDNDGNVDLYIGNESSEALSVPSQLFHNNGDGTFTDLAREAGVQNRAYAKSVIWGDFDGDRWPDLYVSNLRGPNRLYHNQGDGTFNDIAGKLNVDRPEVSFPAWFWDIDNDGILDLYVSAYSATIADLAASLLGRSLNIELACLYRGDGNGGFEEVASRYNLRHPTAPMGSNFGDLDNDGYLDFYLGTGYPDYRSIMPNVMYRNQEGRRFADVSAAGGFSHLQKGHAVIFADLDHDGDQDIFEQMGGAFPGDGYGNVLYENPGFGNHWITIKLVGTRSNRSAIGARIRIEVFENGVRRWIYKHVNSGGTFGANPLRQTIGLGKTSKIEMLEVSWPATGLKQVFHDVGTDQFIQIVEGEGSYTPLRLERLIFSGG